VNDKLTYHIKKTVGPLAILGDAAYAGILQEADTPTEWDRVGAATVSVSGRRSRAPGSIAPWLLLGLDAARGSALFPFGRRGFWRRAAHAFRGTILTRRTVEPRRCPCGVWAAHMERPIYRTSGIRAGSTRWAWGSPRVPCNSGSIWPATWQPSSGRISGGRSCGENHNRTPTLARKSLAGPAHSLPLRLAEALE